MEPPAGTNAEDTDSTLRRPMNAFLLFCKRHRSIVKNGHPWLDNRSCTKMLADMWAVLDWDEKSKYLQLARECKTAFMKAHPDYKWCGSNKHNTKGSTPTMRTRTKSSSKHQQKPSIGVWTPDNWSKLKSPSSSCKISAGKLADPCDMGGLSLLLLAGEQTMSKAAATTCPVSNMPLSPKSKLFEFAEMCSDQLDLVGKCSISPDMSELTRHITDHNANITLDDKTSLKERANCINVPLDTVNHRCCSTENIKTEVHERCMHEAAPKEKESVNCHEKDQVVDRRKDVAHRSNEDTAQPFVNKMDITVCGSSSLVTDKELSRLESRVQCSGNEDDGDEDDGDDDMLDQPSGSDAGDWVEEHPNRRKSSRSCKGRLYREYVMEGMLESLQRPERPFNCKKSWKHLEGSSLSDGDDIIFEPNPDKPKRVSRRSIRKRTVSGCGSLPSSTDFDYGEIDVEARLASLPQYSPDQFKPKGKCHRQKKSTCLYKNSTFVKKDSKGTVRRDQSASASCFDRIQVAGSRKRKAPKSSILHLTLSQSQTSQVSPGTSSNARQFVVNNHQRNVEKVSSHGQPSSASIPSTSSQRQAMTDTDGPALSALDTKAFTHPLMVDSTQHPSNTTHAMTVASNLHLSVVTVS